MNYQSLFKIMKNYNFLVLLALIACHSEHTELPIRNGDFIDETHAHQLYERMITKIKSLPVLYYESVYKTNFSPWFMYPKYYRIWLKKPNSVRIESYTKMSLFDIVLNKCKLSGVLVGDDSNYWIYWPDKRPFFSWEKDISNNISKCYFNVKYPVTTVLNRFLYITSIDNCILEPQIFFGQEDALNDYMDGIRVVHKEEIDDIEYIVVEISYMQGQRKKFIWISTETFLPRKMKEFVKTAKPVMFQEEWINIVTYGDFQGDIFKWDPPDYWHELHYRNAKLTFLEKGIPAPDFKLSTTTGKQISLSNFRGKVIWLCFWKQGCPPCRKELVYLQNLYAEQKKYGLIVIGINTIDDESALNFLSVNNIEFYNIIDNSKVAQKIDQEIYQCQEKYAVPLNYIIDKNGNIVEGWYGFKKGDTRGIDILKEMGIPIK